MVILSGQPRRHLLTTGWSIFVSQKNLVSGDAVLFLRCVYVCVQIGFCFKNIINTDSVKNYYTVTVSLNYKPSAMCSKFVRFSK